MSSNSQSASSSSCLTTYRLICLVLDGNRRWAKSQGLPTPEVTEEVMRT
ncbi:hypothetical protein H6801_02940 [Candidatus Nomurabacteria bacterium]|nr:hypothetical protein [Candidatus Nomurabacteria bacterium]